MPDFDPARACRSFRPDHAGRGRRRSTALHFVAQATPSGEARFVVKAYAAAGEGPDVARARLQRELDGQAAFARLGEAVLSPCAGPFERLELRLDGGVSAVPLALVYPYRKAPTLFDVLRAGSVAGGGAPDEAAPLLGTVAARMAARHAVARAVSDLHSDGAAHNLLVLPPPVGAPAGEPALLWFDFAEPHAASEVPEARAVELLAFLLSVVEASRAGAERARVGLVCAGYPDRAVLDRVLAIRSPRHPAWYALRHRLRLRQWRALRRGDTTQLGRYRLLRALRSVLAR